MEAANRTYKFARPSEYARPGFIDSSKTTVVVRGAA